MKNNDAFYLTIPLVQSIEKAADYSGNYLVYGDGGFGKTTSVLMLFKYFLSKAKNGENIVPLYIDSKGLDFTYDKPLFEYIIREYCGLNKDISKHIETLNDLLKNSDKKYYIIIDAINEAESNKFKIICDIASLKEIFDKNHAGRLIVSSRTDETVNCFNDFKRIKMLDFTDEQIVDFLNKYDFKNKGKPIDKIDVTRIDENLLKILRVPMFLKIFKDVYKDEDVFPNLYTKNIVRESDLLSKFVEKIFKDKMDEHKAEQSPEYIKCYFVLKRFLPALAFEFAKNDEFSISESGLDDLFKNKFNESYFKQFQNRRENYFKHAGNLDDLLNDCIDDFSFIVCKGENKNVEYSFSHQVWRDYFAAVYLTNSIDYDVTSEFEHQISSNIQQYVGELIKEYEFENKIDILSPMSPIEAFMQRNSKKLSPLAVSLCVEIMKKSRNGKITAIYDNLDLKCIDFYYCNLKNSSFNASKIYSLNFINPLEQNVKFITFVSNNKLILRCNDSFFSYDLDMKKLCYYASFELIDFELIDFDCNFFENQGNKKILLKSNRINDLKLCVLYNESKSLKRKTYSGPFYRNVIEKIIISEDKNYIISVDKDNVLYAWNTINNEIIEIKLNKHVEVIRVSKNNKYLVVLLDDDSLLTYELKTLCEIFNFNKSNLNFTISQFIICPNEPRIICVNYDNEIIVLDLVTGEIITENPYKVSKSTVTTLAISLDSKYMAFGCESGEIILVELKNNILNKILSFYEISQIRDLIFSPYNILVSIDMNSHITFWDITTLCIRDQLYYKKGLIRSLNRDLLVADFGNIFKVFDGSLQKCNSFFDILSFTDNYKKFYFNNHPYFVTQLSKNEIILINYNNNNFINLKTDIDFMQHAVISADDQLIAILSYDGSVELCNIVYDSRKFRPQKIVHKESSFLKFSMDGRMLYTISYNSIIGWDVDSGNVVFKKETNDCFIGGFNVKYIYSNGTTIGTIYTNDWGIDSVSISYDGKCLAYGNTNGIISLVDSKTGKNLLKTESVLRNHIYSQECINVLSFSMNGEMVVSGGNNGTMTVFKIKKNKLKKLKSKSFYKIITTIRFINYDKNLLICFENQECIVWNVKKWFIEDKVISIDANIENCNFSKSKFINNFNDGIFKFYKTMYQNGADVPEEYEPKPIPFEWNDEELNDKESE